MTITRQIVRAVSVRYGSGQTAHSRDDVRPPWSKKTMTSNHGEGWVRRWLMRPVFALKNLSQWGAGDAGGWTRMRDGAQPILSPPAALLPVLDAFTFEAG